MVSTPIKQFHFREIGTKLVLYENGVKQLQFDCKHDLVKKCNEKDYQIVNKNDLPEAFSARLKW